MLVVVATKPPASVPHPDVQGPQLKPTQDTLLVSSEASNPSPRSRFSASEAALTNRLSPSLSPLFAAPGGSDGVNLPEEGFRTEGQLQSSRTDGPSL